MASVLHIYRAQVRAYSDIRGSDRAVRDSMLLQSNAVMVLCVCACVCVHTCICLGVGGMGRKQRREEVGILKCCLTIQREKQLSVLTFTHNVHPVNFVPAVTLQ